MKFWNSFRLLIGSPKKTPAPEDDPKINQEPYRWDVFISHASEEKDSTVIPLRDFLVRHGISVWLDKSELRLGDALEGKIGLGLTKSQFGIVVLSPTFFSKNWTKRELDLLLSMEKPPHKVVLPVLHGIALSQLKQESPQLVERLMADTDEGIENVGRQLLEAIYDIKKQQHPGFIKLTDDGTPDDIDLIRILTRYWKEKPELSLIWPQTFVNAIVANQDLSERLAPATGSKEKFCLKGSSELLREMAMQNIVSTASSIREQRAAFEVRLPCLIQGLSSYAGQDDTYIRSRSLKVFCRLAYVWVTACFDGQSAWIPWNSVAQKNRPGDQIRAATGSKEEMILAEITALNSNNYPVSDLGHLTVWAPRSAWENLLWDRANPELLELYLVPQIEFKLMVLKSNVNLQYSCKLERWRVTNFKDENKKPVYISDTRPNFT